MIIVYSTQKENTQREKLKQPHISALGTFVVSKIFSRKIYLNKKNILQGKGLALSIELSYNQKNQFRALNNEVV